MSLISILCAAALLTASEIGPENMPKSIEPVEAPFVMPEFSRPQFPARTVQADMKEKGLSTDRIQTAIDKMSGSGGGTVVIPAGVWHTGRIILKSNVNLHLAEGAELCFSGNIRDYQPAVLTRDEGIDVL